MVTLRRDKSILYSRIVIIMLTYWFLIALNLNIAFSNNVLGLYVVLSQSKKLTQIFPIFIIALGAVIFQLTAFYPRKAWVKKCSTFYKLINSVVTSFVSIVAKMYVLIFFF